MFPDGAHGGRCPEEEGSLDCARPAWWAGTEAEKAKGRDKTALGSPEWAGSPSMNQRLFLGTAETVSACGYRGELFEFNLLLTFADGDMEAQREEEICQYPGAS